jgi:hypothetical protein
VPNLTQDAELVLLFRHGKNQVVDLMMVIMLVARRRDSRIRMINAGEDGLHTCDLQTILLFGMGIGID